MSAMSLSDSKMKSKKGRISRPFLLGAGGGTRTHTVSLPTDFESVTSAIPSHRRVIDWVNIYIITGRREKSKENLQPAAVLRSEELRVSCGF